MASLLSCGSMEGLKCKIECKRYMGEFERGRDGLNNGTKA